MMHFVNTTKLGAYMIAYLINNSALVVSTAVALISEVLALVPTPYNGIIDMIIKALAKGEQ